MRFSSFGFTTQQAERAVGTFLAGIIVGFILTICVTVLAVIVGVKVNL